MKIGRNKLDFLWKIFIVNSIFYTNTNSTRNERGGIRKNQKQQILNRIQGINLHSRSKDKSKYLESNNEHKIAALKITMSINISWTWINWWL